MKNARDFGILREKKFGDNLNSITQENEFYYNYDYDSSSTIEFVSELNT